MQRPSQDVQLPRSICVHQAHRALVKCGTGDADGTWRGCRKRARLQRESDAPTNAGQDTGEATDQAKGCMRESSSPQGQDDGLPPFPMDQQDYGGSGSPEPIPPHPQSPHSPLKQCNTWERLPAQLYSNQKKISWTSHRTIVRPVLPLSIFRHSLRAHVLLQTSHSESTYQCLALRCVAAHLPFQLLAHPGFLVMTLTRKTCSR